jgi:hypothetical protein
LPTDLLGAFLVAWLLLSKLIANDALIAGRPARRLRHSLLPAVLSALILPAFEIVFLWHLRNPQVSRSGNRSCEGFVPPATHEAKLPLRRRASIAESPMPPYIHGSFTTNRNTWHDEQAAPIFRFTADGFRHGWQNAWLRLAPLFARRSSITTAATNSCSGCRIHSGFNRLAP